MKRSGYRPFTTTASSGPRKSSISSLYSSVSLTGISSGSATARTPVFFETMKSWIRSAWWRIGPTRAMSANVRGARSMPRPWPVAGESTTTKSYGRASFVLRWSWASSQIFPIVTSSLIPGAAEVRCWKIPLRYSRPASVFDGSW